MAKQHSVEQAKVSTRQVPHFVALDSIRGIAALSVVLYHMSWTSFVEAQSYVRNSYLMVDLFFVLSGFVIFYAYGNRIRAASDAVRFMWLRFWRLYPLHFTFLIVFLLIECLKAFVQWRFGLIANHPAFSSNNFSAFIGNLFLLQSLHIYHHITFNYPSWSISAEFYTYIVFALLVLWPSGKRALLVRSALTCTLAAGFLIYLGPTALGDTNDYGIVRCLTGFFLGVLTFALHESLRPLKFIRSNAGPMNWLAFVAFSGFVVFIAFKHRGYSDLAIYPLSATLVLLVALSPPAGPIRFLSTAPFVWLGTVSYSIYMVHASVEWGVAQVLRFAMHAKEAISPFHATPVLVPGTVTGLCAVAAFLAIVLMLSHFTYAWIEKPLRDWSKTVRLSRQSRPAAPHLKNASGNNPESEPLLPG